MGKVVKLTSISLISLCLIGCQGSSILPDTSITNKNINYEVKDKVSHVASFQENGYNYIYDYNTKKVSKNTKATVELSSLLDKDIQPDYIDKDKGEDIFDIYSNAKMQAPFDYSLTLEQSLGYLDHLLSLGYSIEVFYKSPTYLDYYISKDNKITRLIITKNNLKIFKNTKENFTDCWTYINERE